MSEACPRCDSIGKLVGDPCSACGWARHRVCEACNKLPTRSGLPYIEHAMKLHKVLCQGAQ